MLGYVINPGKMYLNDAYTALNPRDVISLIMDEATWRIVIHRQNNPLTFDDDQDCLQLINEIPLNHQIGEELMTLLFHCLGWTAEPLETTIKNQLRWTLVRRTGSFPLEPVRIGWAELRVGYNVQTSADIWNHMRRPFVQAIATLTKVPLVWYVDVATRTIARHEERGY